MSNRQPRNHDIRRAVVVEIRRTQWRVRSRSRCKHRSVPQSALAVADQQFDLTRAPAIDRCVQRLVRSAEMADRDAMRMRISLSREWRTRSLAERSVAVAEKKPHVGGLVIRHD